MQKFLIAAISMSALLSLAAQDVCRVSLQSKEPVVLASAEADTDNVILSAPSWGDAANRQYRLVGSSEELSADKYTEVSFSFKPEQDAKVIVQAYGNYAKDRANRRWILIKEVKINDKPAWNSNFAKLKPNGLPKGYFGGKGLKLVDDNGEKALCANHDNRASFVVPIAKAGEVCNVKFLVKAAK